MKNITTTILLALSFALIPSIIQAQLSGILVNSNDSLSLMDIKPEMNNYFDSLLLVQDSATFYSEGGEHSEYMKFLEYWEPILMPHGEFSRVFDSDSISFSMLENNYDYFSDEQWKEVGPVGKPDNTYNSSYKEGIGPVEYLSIYDDGTVESTRYMLAASILGGVFYSTDYGETWNSTGTDLQTGLTGSGCAIFNPTNHTEWFASTTGNSNSGTIGKTGGIFRTSDEGETYTKIAAHSDIGGAWNIIYKLLIVQGNTTDALFAITKKGIYRSTDFYSPNVTPTWAQVIDGLCYDLEVKPDDNSVLYATHFDNGAWKVTKSNDAGVNWLVFTTQPQLVEDSDTRNNSFTIEVSKAKQEIVYCLVNQPGNQTNL